MNNLISERTFDPRTQRLLKMITNLQEEESILELKRMLEDGFNPKELQACFMEGMRQVGTLFENGNYFIAGLIMAGEIMRSAMEILGDYLVSERIESIKGTVLIGTIQGDIHDLGKNLFSFLLKCHGFKITDLGVDIPGSLFLEKANEVKPDIIGISCTLTQSVGNLKKAVKLLKKKLLKPQPGILVGGTCLDERMAKHVGASTWAEDAATGLKICQRMLSESSNFKKVKNN